VCDLLVSPETHLSAQLRYFAARAVSRDLSSVPSGYDLTVEEVRAIREPDIGFLFHVHVPFLPSPAASLGMTETGVVYERTAAAHSSITIQESTRGMYMSIEPLEMKGVSVARARSSPMITLVLPSQLVAHVGARGLHSRHRRSDLSSGCL
jgi:hypothetical protein